MLFLLSLFFFLHTEMVSIYRMVLYVYTLAYMVGIVLSAVYVRFGRFKKGNIEALS